MADGELEKLAGEAGALTEAARDMLKAELSKRGSTTVLSDSAAAKDAQSPKLVTLRRYVGLQSMQEALLDKSILDSAGIECFLFDENMIRLDWFLSNALGGIKLRVRQEDAETAAALLEESQQDATDAEKGNE
ncbi:MAG: DUF2007 domain-containing protein [Candidatus Acidiferrales bacterium]|jgi:hypothetical protein